MVFLGNKCVKYENILMRLKTSYSLEPVHVLLNNVSLRKIWINSGLKSKDYFIETLSGCLSDFCKQYCMQVLSKFFKGFIWVKL